jgi:hypothetical protein
MEWTLSLLQTVLVAIGGAVGGALLSQFVEIFLPERVRIWFLLKKKLAGKWVRNPSYVIGITALLNFRERAPLDEVQRQMKGLFSSRGASIAGTELHFREATAHTHINARIQLAYDEDKQGAALAVYGLNATVDVQARYREIRDRIEDLRGALSNIEGALVKEFAVFPSKRALYIEVDRLEEFSEWLENLEAQQITGKIKNADAEFQYHDRRLVIEDTINAATITWLKKIVAHVG